MKAPAKNPCGSCPYRKDAPSGLWHPDEYAKLPAYDNPTFAQPPAMFGCHQNTGALCSGWCGTHDMDENLALRIGAASGDISVDDIDAARTYTSPVPLFATGADAAAHGMRDIANPDDRTLRTADKLLAKGATR